MNKRILLSILCSLALVGYVAAQNCTVAVTPSNVTVVETSAGVVDVTFGTDPCPRTGNSACPGTDNNSVVWYVGFYSHSAPTPNGLDLEYSTASVIPCSNGQFESAIMTNGGAYNTTTSTCNDVKGSTCVSSVLGQDIGGEIHTWAGDEVCSRVSETITYTGFNLCTGVCYDVYMWEIILDVPEDTGPNNNAALLGGQPTLQAALSCTSAGGPFINIVDESPASVKTTICTTGALNEITAPTLTVTGADLCGGNGAYTNMHTIVPDDTDATDDVPGTCDPTSTDQETQYAGGATDGTGDGTFVQDGGNVQPGSNLVATLAAGIAAGGSGTGNSINGELDLGAHVIEVNCRANVSMSFSTPNSCKGTTPLGAPLCDAAIGTTTAGAVVYLTANTMPISQIVPNAYPVCAQLAGGVGNGLTTTTCNSDYGIPGGGNGQQDGTGYASGYPSGWSALFDRFVQDSDGDGNPDCFTNLSGNPFANGANPFGFPGTATFDYGDGITRQVSTICARYEDACNGTKSITCLKFISDASPLSGTVEVCPVTCANGVGTTDDGTATVTVQGGSADPNIDGDDADGANTFADYTVTVGGAAATQVGATNVFTATGLAPGTYNVLVQDNGTGCGAACDVNTTITILPPPTAVFDAPVVTGGCDNSDDNTIDVTLSATTTSAPTDNGVVFVPNAVVPGTAGNGGVVVNTTTSGFYAGCSIGALNDFWAQVCFDNVTSSIGDLNGFTLDVYINGGFISEVASGGGVTVGGMNIMPEVTNGFSACFPILANPGSNFPGTPLGDLLAGANPNGIDLEIQVFDVAASGNTLSWDDAYFVFNDYTCAQAPADFTACGGANAGTAPADNPTAGITWTPNSNGTGGTPTAAQLTLNGDGTAATFTINNAQMFTGTYCYDVVAYTPGGNFDGTVTAAACVNGQCCQVMSEVCFDATNCVPAELVAFTGQPEDKVNVLNWETASELNTAWFAVERSIDGKAFQELGRVAAAGNSVEALNYDFTDVKPFAVSYYRLRIIDADGTYEYSNVITINRKENRKGIVEVFPIPTDNDVTVQYEVATNTDVTFTLTDVLGRVVSQEVVEANQGLNYYSVDMTTRATGLYFVTFSDGTIEQTRRVIKN